MISIIIINKNDRKIEDTLNNLISIKKPEKTEIIVVDASGGKLDDIKKRFKKVRWIPFINKTIKKITIPEQRNLGIKKARGDIIVFIDAGCIPDSKWLINLIKPLRELNESFVTGNVSSVGGKSIYDVSWTLLGKAKYRKEAGAANTAFLKRIINEIGNYDESFDYGSDIDFTWRVIDTGYKIRYVRDSIIYHNWGNFKQQIRRALEYGKARVRLYKKHPSHLYDLFGSDFVSFIYPLYLILLPITVILPYYPLLIFIPLIKNFKRSPFKSVFINLVTAIGILKEVLISVWQANN